MCLFDCFYSAGFQPQGMVKKLLFITNRFWFHKVITYSKLIYRVSLFFCVFSNNRRSSSNTTTNSTRNPTSFGIPFDIAIHRGSFRGRYTRNQCTRINSRNRSENTFTLATGFRTINSSKQKNQHKYAYTYTHPCACNTLSYQLIGIEYMWMIIYLVKFCLSA